jgi:CDP-paratose 2-epimerase
MNSNRILIAGGAGFIGSHLAVRLKQSYPDVSIMVLDNLHRRGSELSLSRLDQYSVAFHRGHIRCSQDLEALPPFDLLAERSG